MNKLKQRLTLLALILLAVQFGQTPAARGQKPPAPVAPNPQAPVLAMPMPMGMQRGTSLDMTITGTNLAGPTGFLAGPFKITIPTVGKNGQDNTQIKLHLTAAADAPLGYYPLRLATARGMSNLRLFCIDDLPQVLKSESNTNFDVAQSAPIPCVVAGRTAAEKADYYKITVAAGQRVAFEVLGRRLGSPIDPQITLLDAKTRRELAYDNDAPGCQTDPRLVHVFKEAGDYVLEIKDVLNRGGPDYVYRLRIGDFPLATVPIPMAAKRGAKVRVQFAGPQVAGVQPVEVDVPTDPTTRVMWLAPKGPNGLHGWPVALAISDVDEAIENEPNNAPAQANRVANPGSITGRFQMSDDTDCYVFAAKKGQKITVAAQTLELYSPTLVYMVIKNPRSKAELARSNPQSPPPADQRIDFTAPEDGDFVLEVQHLTYAGGPSEAYHITLMPTRPAFDISLGLDRFDVAPDSFVLLNLVVNRRGYAGPIEVNLHGPAGLAGSGIVKARQNAGTIQVTAKGDVPPGPYVVTLTAKYTDAGQTIVEPVSVKAAVSASLQGLPYPPLQFNHQVALAVKQRAPFSLVTRMEPPEGVPGLATQLIVSVKRSPGFTEEIAFNPLAGLPPAIPIPKLPNIPKDKNEVSVKLDVNGKTPAGEYQLLITGKAKAKDKEYTANAWPFPLLIGAPFDLKVEPVVLDLKPGAKAKLTVTAKRKGGYQGPIALDVRNLPAGVTALKSTISANQSQGALEISAAAKTTASEKKDVQVNGRAAALNNLQNASPAFTVRVR